MDFRVEISARAKRDLDLILEWLLGQQAGAAGYHWFDGLSTAFSSLNLAPRRCRLVPENERSTLEGPGSCFTVISPIHNRILFTVERDLVTILHVRHSRRLELY